MTDLTARYLAIGITTLGVLIYPIRGQAVQTTVPCVREGTIIFGTFGGATAGNCNIDPPDCPAACQCVFLHYLSSGTGVAGIKIAVSITTGAALNSVRCTGDKIVDSTYTLSVGIPVLGNISASPKLDFQLTVATNSIGPQIVSYKITGTKIIETATENIAANGAVVAYPNPFDFRVADHKAQGIVFQNVLSGTALRIFDASGTLMRTLFGNSNNTVIWDVKNENGEELGMGLYLYGTTDIAGKKATGKFGIVR